MCNLCIALKDGKNNLTKSTIKNFIVRIKENDEIKSYPPLKEIMRLIISILCIAYSIVYAVHFQDMLSNQTTYTSTLHKDYETDSVIHYKGAIHLSGVLEWQMYEDEVDFYWRLVKSIGDG